MESEKETAGANDNQEGKKGSTEVEEKGPIEDDAGCAEPGKLEEIEGVEEAKQENEKAVENEEMKEGGGNTGEEEEGEGKGKGDKEEEEEEEKGEEEVEEGKSGGDGEEDDAEEGTGTEKKSVSRKKRTPETVELSSPRTPGSDRPTRERKTVERFTVNESARSSTPKPLAIEKGQGTQLKDIPNVAFKLSKRKADENLHLLHTILFGKKAKVHNLKKNIGLFSGFVWADNEGKQRAKFKEKLDKCVKEKMLDFCDVLNIPVNRATIKKEELSTKLIEFLESPHATSDMLLADKEKGKRRKSNDPVIKIPGSSNAAGEKYTKKQKLDSESGKKRKHSTEENDDKSEPSQSEDDQEDNTVPPAETDDKENDSGEETEEEQGAPNTEVVETSSLKKSAKKKDTGRTVDKSAGKKIPTKASNTPAKSTKKSSSSLSKKDAANSESKSKEKTPSTEKQKAGKKSEVGTSTPAKGKAASKSSTGLKKGQEGKSSKKAKKEPTREEMHAVVANILKEVDFNTATLSDILRQLGEHFGLDLLHRKSEVKDIITEAINNMSDDEDEEASESGDESGKDGGDDEA